MTDPLTRLVAELAPLHLTRELDRLGEVVLPSMPEGDRSSVLGVIRRYYWLYTVPIFGRAGFWRRPEDEDRSSMRSLLDAHVFLCVHLRFIDNLLDQDAPPDLAARQLRIALKTLECARRAVEAAGREWGAEADALYDEYLAYDTAAREGEDLGAMGLWQRVSPLVIVPELYLRPWLDQASVLHFREYLGFMLLVHDLSDVFKDMSSGTRSLATQALRQSGARPVFSRRVVELAFAEIETREASSVRVLTDSLDCACPEWSTVVGFCLREFKSEGVRP